MPRTTTIEIKETAKELSSLMKDRQAIKVREKIQVLYLLKSGQCQQINLLALIVCRHRKTIHQWLSDYKREGLNSLLNSTRTLPGRKSNIPSDVIEIIRAKLLEREFSSYKQIQNWLQTNYQISVKYHVVRDLVTKKLQLHISR